jgi:hypothetical protein
MYLTETIEANVYIFLYIGYTSVFSSFSPFFTDVEYYVHPSTLNLNLTYMGFGQLGMLLYRNNIFGSTGKAFSIVDRIFKVPFSQIT